MGVARFQKGDGRVKVAAEDLGGTTGAVQLRQLTIIIRPRRMFLLRVI